MIRIRSSFFLLFSAVALSFLTGCSSDKVKLRKTLEAFRETSIHVPADLLLIQEGRIRPWQQTEGDIPTLIMYIGPEECSECRISHLPECEELFRWSEASGLFRFMIIFSPRPDDMDRIQAALMTFAFERPVYLDYYSEFATGNAIPEDSRTHCFLVNTEQRPVFFGNPLGSPRMRELFTAQLDTLLTLL